MYTASCDWMVVGTHPQGWPRASGVGQGQEGTEPGRGEAASALSGPLA